MSTFLLHHARSFELIQHVYRLIDVPSAFGDATTSPAQSYYTLLPAYSFSGLSVECHEPQQLQYPEAPESIEMPYAPSAYVCDLYLPSSAFVHPEPFEVPELVNVPSPAVSPYLPSPSEMPFNTATEPVYRASGYFDFCTLESASNGWSSSSTGDYSDSDSSSYASSPVSTPPAYDMPYVCYASPSSAPSSASSSPRLPFASTRRCRSSSSKLAHPMGPTPPAPRPKMRTRQVASRLSRPPVGMARPETVHDLKNGLTCTVPGCEYSVESRRPDLLRHVQAHFGRQWVCCGVPLVEAAKHGINVEGLGADEAYWSEEAGHMMIGGCGLMFTRKDAYKRHLKRRDLRGRAICMGNPDGLWHMKKDEE